MALPHATGESMTTAVRVAVAERLERVRASRTGPPTAEALLEIGRDVAGRLGEPLRSAEHGDLLYGEDGLPR